MENENEYEEIVVIDDCKTLLQSIDTTLKAILKILGGN